MYKYKLVYVLLTILLSAIGTASCPVGDLDGNCSVGLGDLVIFANYWLDETTNEANLDGIAGTDFNDYVILAEHWGQVGYRLVINECMADNKGTIEDPDETGEYPDWIEIYNPGSTPINMGGMYLTDALITPTLWQVPTNAPSQTTIQPGGYLLLWADDETTQGPLHVGFKLDAGGEQVGLFDSTGIQIDSITFGSQGTDESYGRYPNGGAGWQVFADGTATPGSTNGGESADTGIIISEIMYHPGHNDLVFEPEPINQEYIELFNTGSSLVDLGGWRFVDGVAIELPVGTTIGANSYLVVAANVAAFSAKHPTVTNVVGGWVGKLSDSGEQITLVNSIGTVIDSVDYCDEGDWAQRVLGPLDYNHRGWMWSSAHDGDGESLEVVCTAISNTSGQNWKASTTGHGTPGTANSVSASDTAPIIADAKHMPAIPGSSDPVVVTAEIIDADLAGVSVTLQWRVDTSVYIKSEYPTYVPASYTTISMVDDGLNGDGQAGDGVYGATIPAQANEAVVEFFITASDTQANTRTWPAACDVDGTPQQVANMLYQVNDAFATETTWSPGKQPVYYLVMTEAERGRIEDIGDGGSDEQYSDAQMNATFVSADGVDTKSRYTVGVRNRGNGSRRLPPNNYRVNFRHDDPWKNVTAININSKYTYLQLVGNSIFRLAGLYAADATAVQVRVNGQNLAVTETIPSRMYGTYVHLEVLDGDFAATHFPDDGGGNMYKAAIYPQVADMTYLGTNPADYVARGYSKGTNESENDWTDLFEMTNVLENEPDATYTDRLEQVVDTDQWIRWYAVQALIGNGETNLGNGYGDDYRIYRGVVDPRFKLVTHDMDTILGEGDYDQVTPDESIWRCIAPHTNVHMVVIERFLQHPDYVWKYYAELKKATETIFAPETMNPLLDSLLGGFVPESKLADMKQFVLDRNASVLSQIPLTFSAESSLPVVSGYYQTTTAIASVNGTADATETRAVRVNGLLANWDGVEGTWSLTTGLSLLPGINRVSVQTYGAPEGTGDELHRGYVDIWYDDGNQSSLSGTLAVDTVLTAASGPWHVTGDIVIPAGVTLTIQAGTTVFFDTAAGITVNGALVAEGTEFAHIRMAPNPGSATRWDGLSLQNTPADSRLVYVDMEYGDGQGDSVIVNAARVFMNYMTFTSTNDTTPFMELTHPQAIIQNCVFPSIGGTEPLHGSGLSGSEYLIFDGCTIGQTTGYNDILDFTGGKRPGPIIQMYNNFFPGGGDDALDFDGTDGHVEGNIFLTFANGYDGNVDHTTANAVATDFGSDVVIARNLFVGGDHHILLKNDVAITSQNNTFVGATMASINFGEPARGVDPGAGAYLENNIFWDDARIFYNIFDNPAYPGYGPDPMPSIFNTIVPAQWHSLGADNLDAAPQFADPAVGDYSLQPGSSAIGAGTNGLDMGYQVSAGASISGAPAPISYMTEATLSVGGPGIVSYRWRLVDNGVPGAWSSEISLPIASDNYILGTLSLAGLQNGHTYRVDVVGKNSAGLWQGQQFSDTDFVALGNAEGNSSQVWTVDTSFRMLVINEVLASNVTTAHEGTYPDMIELFYDGPSPIDLGGYRLTDNMDLPEKFVFAPGTIMNPGDYLVLYADVSNTSGIHTGFSIDSGGDDLTLLNAAGQVVDSVVFGMQLDDKSVGRIGFDRHWTLTEMTFGGLNTAAPRGDARELKINEWLADGKILFVDDWMELYNPMPYAVDMGGLYMTDDPVAEPNKCQVGSLSFIEAFGYAVFIADKTNASGHLSFNLSADGEILSLFDADLHEIDKVLYGPHMTDTSQGRMPDGGQEIGFFDLPTPGASNINVVTTVTTDPLIGIEDIWSYEQSGDDLGTLWRNAGYNDSAWPSGAALLYVESSSLPAPKNTPLTLGQRTYYFRRHFTFNGNPADVDHLDLSTVLDDGAVIYLNGVEVFRIRIDSGTVTHSTWASDPAVGNAGYESFTIPAAALQNGDNVIAVEVHQAGSDSSDVVFGLELDAVSTTTVIDDPYVDDRAVLSSLRITEIMYNPAADPNSEFIELQNISDTTIDLEGVRFTAGIDFTFPAMTLAAGEYTVVVSRQDVFEARYGALINVAGEYVGKLSNGGEEVVLRLAEPLDAAVMRFEYKDGWYPTTDGGGYSLVIADPTGTLKSWRDAESWRPSYAAGGTPGRDDIAGVMINEVLAHSHDIAPDWVELYNPTASPVDVGGWYLSDSADNLMKYQISNNTIIPSGGYLVLYENTDFGTQFALSENGDEVYLSSAESGALTGYTVEVSFGASETGISFGLYEKSDGTTVFVSMASVTPNDSNSGPKVGPVVISEIMYNPLPPAGASYPDQDYEYIELHNITGLPVMLDYYDGETLETLGWTFTAGIDYTFPLGTTIPANGYLIVAKNPAAFTEKHGTISAAVLGPFENDSKLSNGGELLELSMPGDTDLAGTRYYILVDWVLYDDESPWPATPDGGGQALDRIDDGSYGDDFINWQAQNHSPGL